jgi:hypothetical protein
VSRPSRHALRTCSSGVRGLSRSGFPVARRQAQSNDRRDVANVTERGLVWFSKRRHGPIACAHSRPRCAALHEMGGVSVIAHRSAVHLNHAPRRTAVSAVTATATRAILERVTDPRATDETRIDRWLCAVRLVKARPLATRLCEGGHVVVNESAGRGRPSREHPRRGRCRGRVGHGRGRPGARGRQISRSLTRRSWSGTISRTVSAAAVACSSPVTTAEA